ncbi:MAG: hypothetical protein FWE09_04680, partial [Treponema sp.]|nr:hypothetical protein [Treponema sp.]
EGAETRALNAADALPAGLYAFAQKRRELRREECAAMAMDLQKDAIWEGHHPGSILYLRLLFEDGSPVTQLFRPCQRLPA